MKALHDFIRNLVACYSEEEDIYVKVTDRKGAILAASNQTDVGKTDRHVRLSMESGEEIILEFPTSSASEAAHLYIAPVITDEIINYAVVVSGEREAARHIAQSMKRSIESLFSIVSKNVSFAIEKNRERQLIELLLRPEHSHYLVDRILQSLEHDAEGIHCVLVLNAEARENKYFNIHLNLGYHASVESLRQDILRSVKESEKLNSQDIVTYFNYDDIVIVKKILGDFPAARIYEVMNAVSTSIIENLSQYKLFRFRISYGPYVASIHNIWSSYRTAKRSLEIGSIIDPERCFFDPESFLVERLYLNTEDKVLNDTIDNLLSALRSRDGEIDTETLFLIENLIDSGLNFSKTSRITKFHRNTINARLERLKELTGLDPLASFSDQLLIKLTAFKVKQTES